MQSCGGGDDDERSASPQLSDRPGSHLRCYGILHHLPDDILKSIFPSILLEVRGRSESEWSLVLRDVKIGQWLDLL